MNGPVTITTARLITPRPYGRIAASATERITVEVGGEGLETARVSFALVPGQPGEEDWLPGRWDDGSPSEGRRGWFTAGPGGQAAATPGEWLVHVQACAGGGSAQRCAGMIIIT